MKKYYVALVDLFGVRPPVVECDEVRATSPAAAAEKIARSCNEDNPFFERQVLAVAWAREPLHWEYFEVLASVHYRTNQLDLTAASKAAEAA